MMHVPLVFHTRHLICPSFFVSSRLRVAIVKSPWDKVIKIYGKVGKVLWGVGNEVIILEILI